MSTVPLDPHHSSVFLPFSFADHLEKVALVLASKSAFFVFNHLYLSTCRDLCFRSIERFCWRHIPAQIKLIDQFNILTSYAHKPLCSFFGIIPNQPVNAVTRKTMGKLLQIVKVLGSSLSSPKRDGVGERLFLSHLRLGIQTDRNNALCSGGGACRGLCQELT